MPKQDVDDKALEQTPAAPAAGGDGAQPPQEIARLREELALLQDKYIRLQADLDNYRKRMDRTVADLVRLRRVEILRNLLPVVDNLARALDSAGAPSADGQSLLHGVRLTRQLFLEILKRQGVEPISTGGQFNPKYHEVVATVSDPSRAEGEIIDQVLPGFLLEGEVLRPASVRVASKPAPEKSGPVNLQA